MTEIYNKTRKFVDGKFCKNLQTYLIIRMYKSRIRENADSACLFSEKVLRKRGAL